MNLITRPAERDIPEYYLNYTNLADGNDLLEALTNSRDLSVRLIQSIPSDKQDFAYANGKWSIKQVLSHIIDSERVFAYRALRFSRRDSTELPGYEENDYAENANAFGRHLNDIRDEYIAVRDSTMQLYRHMNDEMLDFKGIANKVNFTPRILGWIIVGHNTHHCNVIREKYGVNDN